MNKLLVALGLAATVALVGCIKKKRLKQVLQLANI